MQHLKREIEGGAREGGSERKGEREKETADSDDPISELRGNETH